MACSKLDSIPDKYAFVLPTVSTKPMCLICNETVALVKSGNVKPHYETKHGHFDHLILAVDWIMRQATDNRRNGIQWTLFTQLHDLDFADYFALLSQNHQQMQKKLREVEQKAAETGLHISTQKTKTKKCSRLIQRRWPA